MSAAEHFFDTSVLLCSLSADASKADRVESLLAKRGTISVQVLNEYTAVASRKLAMSLTDIREILAAVRSICRVEPLLVEDHDRAHLVMKRNKFSFYDCLIVASALRAGCKTLYSEDLQHGQVIDRRLTIINPFDGAR